MKLKLNSRGDTIIEVLLACAVASMVLASTFVTVNHTFKNSRQTQEHEEALKIAEGQFEALRGLANDAAAASIMGASPVQFCVNDGGTALSNFGAGRTTHSQANINVAGYYPDNPSHDQCVVKLPGEDYSYYVSITKPSADVYKVNVDWPGATGNIDNVGLLYKLYP